MQAVRAACKPQNVALANPMLQQMVTGRRFASNFAIERSLFDSSALASAGTLADDRSGHRGQRYVSHFWNNLFRHAELVERHPVCADLQAAWTFGSANPLLESLSQQNFGLLSRVIRADSDAGGAKLLIELPDRRRIETVIIAARQKSKATSPPAICVSSQAGCAMACRFCDTGFLDSPEGSDKSNSSIGLPAWAILEQVLHADAFLQREGPAMGFDAKLRHPANVVFMGMGEPLMNYKSVLEACHVLHGGLNSHRRIMLSTVGITPRIRMLANESPKGLRLALSLHAPTQELRTQLLPVAAKAWPLSDLMAAVREFEEKTGNGILLEYILLRGLNDEDHHADALADLILRGDAGRRCAGVNLIPYNPTAAGAAAGLEEPADARCKAFRSRLRQAGVGNVTVRFSTKAGRSLVAACGQLAARESRDGCPRTEELVKRFRA